MPRKREKFLFDMMDSCRFLIDVTSSESVDRFKSDRVFRSAVERELQIIGEAMMQLKALDPDCASQFHEHDRIIGFRHVLVHGYDAIDPDIVWHVVTEKLPILHRELVDTLETSE